MNKRHNFNENFFEIIDSEEKAYWLGFIAADGNLSSKTQKTSLNPSYKLTILLSEDDYTHLIKFNEVVEHNYLPYISKGQYNQVILNSKKMFNDLISKGITPKKSLTLLPPKNVPDELIRHWIRGYFDGDGSVYSSFRQQDLRISILGTKEVLEFISLKTKIETRIDIKNKSRIYKLNFTRKDKVKQFYDYIYFNSFIYLERKRQKFDNYYERK